MAHGSNVHQSFQNAGEVAARLIVSWRFEFRGVPDVWVNSKRFKTELAVDGQDGGA